MRVIPVLDLLGGVVVRGVAGKRDTYRPVESRIVASAEPLPVARALRRHFALSTLYVADLDAILSQRPNAETCRALADDGFELLVDCGVRSIAEAEAAFGAGASAVVAGLETLPNPDVLAELCGRFGSGRIVFSLDLLAGKAMGELAGWRSRDPSDIAREALGAGVRRMIVLDLARVGVRGGLGTLELCRVLRAVEPRLELITGGGVRGPSDLRELRETGVDAALVASALHDGTLTRDALS